MIYPETRRADRSDRMFGVEVADLFRWLEADPREDAEVANWIGAQNAVTIPYLEDLPGRAVFQDRLTMLHNHDTVLAPLKRGDRYVFLRQSGMDDQPRQFQRTGAEGEDQMLLDPNDWSQDGTVALAEWDVSPDGAFLAYAMQVGGTDWRTIRVMDTRTGEVLDDTVEWARFTTIAWAGDGRGFFYARFPAPEEDTSFTAAISGHAVYFHRLGTAQSDDRLIHAPTSETPLVHAPTVMADGRFLIISTSALTGGVAVSVTDLSQDDPHPITLVDSHADSWALLGNVGSRLIFSTQMGAPRGRVMCIDLADPDPVFSELFPEHDDAVLRDGTAGVLGDRIILASVVDATTQLARFRLDGTPDGSIVLPGPGTTVAFRGQPGANEACFAFTGYDTPLTVFRLDVAKNRTTVWAAPELPVDLDDVVVEQRFYTSPDGTRIPLFIMRRADVTEAAPTLLNGYGGFALSIVPQYLPAAMSWVEQGGVYAVANIRGGGEYGSDWHHAGWRDLKQNEFDDFIAAGDYFVAWGITSPDGLAIHGQSNGGLLVGAVVNQRPDLFAAAIPHVGVMDMLRFDRFTGGTLWVEEYGSPGGGGSFPHHAGLFTPAQCP
ncbi:prolyl oligopeptidase family serine peptidase [Paracoccus gahaiensis]|uniref:prolyl oligopeptidase family serine peptidase n=1 Tax=Paracoccus gahaiensis TaxID=1706839 RepID=UPI001B7FC6CD|nr:prolyl oligopeptidase family serine peptidase [Paracoccus gahaiensis]